MGDQAKSLAEIGVDLTVTLVDARNHHTFQPLLYQVATAGLDAGDVCYPTRRIARTIPAVRSLQGRVVDINFDAQSVVLDDSTRLAYDSLILAFGGVTADFGVDGVAEHGFGLKSAADADVLREHVLTQFDRAANAVARGEDVDLATTTIAVVGGGPTGVEMAGGYAELTSRVLLPDYPEIDPKDVRILLIEGHDALLAGFSPKLQANAASTLANMGVEVHFNKQVSRVTANSLEINDGTVVAASTVVWAAGIRAHPLAEAAGLDVGRGGRIVVDEQLRVPGHRNVYAIGDVAATTIDSSGTLAPQVAPVAVQGGEFVSGRIVASLAPSQGTEPSFVYENKGSMATIGRNAAVVELPNGKQFSGFVGWVAWLGLHLVMLMGFRNRASVFVNWAWNYLTYDRGSRAVIDTTPPLAIVSRKDEVEQVGHEPLGQQVPQALDEDKSGARDEIG